MSKHWLAPTCSPKGFSAARAVYHEAGNRIVQYNSMAAAEEAGQGRGPQPELEAVVPDKDGVSQFVAYAAGFAALTASGEVLTWGDERYAACLGREVTDTRCVFFLFFLFFTLFSVSRTAYTN